MGWETRANGGRYYTRTIRQGHRRLREYVGAGPAGELAAAADATRRAEREAVRAAMRAERERVKAIDMELMAFHRTTDLLTRGALMAAGFERYKRQWRVRHDHPGDD